jgi:vacuolar iron transporter family protein
MVACRRVGRKRRHHLDGKSHPWGGFSSGLQIQCPAVGRRWASRRCHVHGGRRIRCVSSQADTEHADLEREKRELSEDPKSEKEELAQIYVARGVKPGLARQVAQQLMAKDALGAHARDELGISEISTARPIQAALASAATFSVGAAGPLILALLSPSTWLLPVVSVGSLTFLALLGMIGAKTGGAEVFRPTIRVVFWGALAMGLTATIGAMVGTAV